MARHIVPTALLVRAQRLRNDLYKDNLYPVLTDPWGNQNITAVDNLYADRQTPIGCSAGIISI